MAQDRRMIIVNEITFEELGLKGAGVSEIFFKWAGNQQLVNDRIKTGNIAIGETNSCSMSKER